MFDRVARWLLLATALTPLVVYRQSFYPFLDGKVFFFRTLIFLAFIAWGVSMFAKPNRVAMSVRLRGVMQNPIVWMVGLFIVSLLISTVFAQEPSRAFWGDMERGEGVVGILFYVAFFFLCAVVFDKKDWIRFFGASVVVGGVLLGYGCYEFFTGVSRPRSLVGNSAYFAGYLLFAITSACILIREQFIKKGSFGRMGRGLFVLAGLFFGGIVLTGTRGALLGAVVALFVVGVFLARKSDIYVWKKVSFRRAFLTLVAVGILCGGIFISTRENSFWQHIPGLDRVAQISFSDKTFQTRLALWDVGIKGVFENGAQKMFFGWGPEHTIFFYNSHLHPESFSYTDAWFDRAHNKIIDSTLSQGLVGLAVYLGIWVVAFFVLIRLKSFSLKMIFGFFGISYFIQNIFLFDSVVTYLFFFGMLAFLIWKDVGDGRMGDDGAGGGKMGRLAQGKVFVGIFGAVALVLWVWGVAIPYTQAWSYIQAKQSGKNVGEFLEIMEKTSSPYTVAQREMRIDFFDSVYRSGLWGTPAFFDLQKSADGLFFELLEKEQNDARLFLNGGRTLLDSWRMRNKDKETLLLAQDLLGKAIELSPNNPSLYYPLIETFLLRNDADNAIAYARHALSLNQDISFSKYYLVLALSSDIAGNRDEIVVLGQALVQDKDFMEKKGEELGKILEMAND